MTQQIDIAKILSFFRLFSFFSALPPMLHDIPSRIAAFLDHTRLLLGQLDQSAIAAARQILLDCYERRGRVLHDGEWRLVFDGTALRVCRLEAGGPPFQLCTA